MHIFKMGGAQITGPLVFRAHFEPGDFLFSRELAAGFAYQQLGCLSAWDRYNSELLYQSVFLHERCLGGRPLTGPEDYLNIGAGLLNLKFSGRDAVAAMGSDAGVRSTLSSVWTLAERSGLDGWERQDLFLSLSAGYLLARHSPEELPISSFDAADRYHKVPSDPDAGRWLEFGGADTLELEPRPGPYCILLEGARNCHLAPGEHLALCRIGAAHGGGKVTLELYHGKYDGNPAREEIAPGDYRYMTIAVNGNSRRPVYLHPVTVKNGYCTMTRRDGRLRWRMFRREWEDVDCGGDVVSFAPEPDGKGWLLLRSNDLVRPGGLDLSRYSNQGIRAQTARLRAGNAVQVGMRGDICLVLFDTGQMVSNLFGIGANGLTSLDDYELDN